MKRRGLTEKQLKMARLFVISGITDFETAIKAFQDHDDEVITEWKKELRESDDVNVYERYGDES